MSDTPATSTDTQAKPVSQRVPDPDKAVSEQQWLAQRKAERAAARQAEAAPEPEPKQEDPKSADPEEDTPANGQAEASQPEAAPEDEDNPDADLRSEESEDDSEQQTETEEDNESESEPFPDTVTALAEHLGYDAKDLADHLQIEVNVNGKRQLMTLSEAANGNMRLEDYRQKTAAVAEERRANEAKLSEAMERQNATIQQLDAVVLRLAQELDMGPSDAELQALRTTDPVAYRNAKDIRDEKMQQFQQGMATRQAYNEQQRQDAETKQAEYRTQQQELLAAVRPDVREPEKAKAYEDRLAKAMTHSDIGYTMEDAAKFFNGPFDHRAILIIEKAAKWDEHVASRKKTRKKLEKLPKPSRPGSRQARTAAQADADQVRSARMKLRNSQSKEDALALLRARRLQRRNAQNGGSQSKNLV